MISDNSTKTSSQANADECSRPELFTVGHSVHTIEAFIALLHQHSITAISDVRSHPYSRRLDHFNREPLEAALKAEGIRYVYLGEELGARRDESEAYDDDRACYTRIATLPKFKEGLTRLQQGTKDFHIALMCSEKEPLDCHRTILICRHLRDDFQIKHILADGSLEEHLATERRLVKKLDITRTLFEPDLTEEDLIEQAYDRRSGEIAYEMEQEEGAIQ